MRAAQLARAAAVALALSCFIGPLRNPDLWWHLSAGRAIAAHRAVPRADFLSHTRQGAPWVDFEWAPQLLYHAVHRVAGASGLIALRLLTMTGVLACSLALLALYGAGPLAQALLILAEACVLYPYADLRPDNFSLLLFALLLLVLEAWRLGRLKLGPGRAALASALLFALWANIHLGLLYGLLLLALHLAQARWKGERGSAKTMGAALGAGLLGCLCTPYGTGLIGVLSQHSASMDTLSALICEWKPARFLSWWVWPYAALLAASAAALAGALASRRRPPAALALAWVFFAAASIAHERHMSYFALLAPAVLYCCVAGRRWLDGRAARLAGWSAAAALTLFILARIGPALGGPRAPQPAAELAAYLDANAGTLQGLRLYNGWADGGYLGYKLWPRYRVFYDGRYIFHDLLEETHQAALSPESWQSFMERRGVELACMRRSPLQPAFEEAPLRGGASARLRRPYYQAFMPREHWALIYWDDREVVFVRRDKVDARWLRAHEYRALWPDDSPRLAYLVEQGRIQPRELGAEVLRHAAESPVSADEGRGLAAWAAQPRSEVPVREGHLSSGKQAP